MARTPGPVWVEVNSELVRSADFVCLRDDAKAAFLMWALSFPAGDLPGSDKLAVIIGRPRPKAAALLTILSLAGFAQQFPGGKWSLASGWVRAHKTSASRVAKFRARTAGHCNVTMDVNVTSPETPIVTLHTPLGNADCNVSSNVSETPPKSQNKIPLRNPLNKTPTSKDEVGGGARKRAPHPETTPFLRVLWSEIGSVPEGWLRNAAHERQLLGLEPVDMAMVAANFCDTYGPQIVNRRTRAEWQGQFNKFTRREHAGKPNGTVSGKSRQIDELARIIEREKRAASGGEILEDGDRFFDRPDDLCLPGEAWREHGGTRQ